MIEIKDRLIRVICTGGDHRLGGMLWDEAIVMYLAEQFRTQTGEESDPLDDPEVLNDLFLQAERGKKTLTQRDKAPFRVTHAGKQARVELDRAKFEEITRHLLDRTIELTREMLADARAKGIRAFDKIILVGGATRMPQVHDRLVAEFGMEPESYDPDEAVAKGAALYGLKESLQDEVQEILAADEPATAEGERGELDLERRLRGAGRRRRSTDLEKQLGFTLTGPGARAGQHADRQRPVQEPGRRRPRRRAARTSSSTCCPATARCRWSAAPTSAPTPTNQAGVDIRVMAGERDSPDPLDCQDVGMATLNLPDGPARPQPDPRQVRHQPRRPAERHRHRPDRRRLDRRRVRDRGRHGRRGGRGTIDGAAAADGIMKERGSNHAHDCRVSRFAGRRRTAGSSSEGSAGTAIRHSSKWWATNRSGLPTDRGNVELMSPLIKHERNKSLLGRLVEILTEELEIPMMSAGFNHAQS